MISSCFCLSANFNDSEFFTIHNTFNIFQRLSKCFGLSRIDFFIWGNDANNFLYISVIFDVIKNDIARLIITIEDSSMGLKSSVLERITIDNKVFSSVYTSTNKEEDNEELLNSLKEFRNNL